ncbi:MAG: glycosyltransferase family 2 protein [Gemmatimonadaceae bacterium]|nr:glycosyltransferase family 2 protein [Gemmatimonadaceae bacterium]
MTVVLSAYNGGRYIAEQIESIRGQSLTGWNLVVRDDGSRDDTVSTVRKLIARDPRISLMSDAQGNLGPWASFGKLLSHACDRGADYVFMSDQDDVWVPTKMEQQLDLLREAGRSEGRETPALVHSDLEVVDSDLRPLHPSFSAFQKMSYNTNDPLRTLLIHNAVAGCTVALNRPLLEAALPLPAGCLHDWWVALCAAALGKIRCTPGATVRYRQHASNVVGAGPRHAFLRTLVRHPLSYTASSFREFGIGVEQAINLRDRMRVLGVSDAVRLRRVEQYCNAFSEDQPLVARLRALRNSGARPQRIVSRVLMQAIVATYPAVNALMQRSASPMSAKRIRSGVR